jgi:hypothetical protein
MVLVYAWAALDGYPIYTSYVAGMTGMCRHQLLVEMGGGVSWTPSPHPEPGLEPPSSWSPSPAELGLQEHLASWFQSFALKMVPQVECKLQLFRVK